MMKLYWCEISDGIPVPDFGGAFHAHITQKKHPASLLRSLTAWKLLETALREMGFDTLPEVQFSKTGKPYFSDLPLHFSLSHSGNLTAVILADAPCAVDVEQIRPDISEKLHARCMHPEEIQFGCSFFDVWTKKECIGKLDGSGIPAKPKILNTRDIRYEGRFFSREIVDSHGERYSLSALCEGMKPLSAEKRTIIEG